MVFEVACGLLVVAPRRDAKRNQRELAGELSATDSEGRMFEAAYGLSVFGFDGRGCL